MHWMDRRDEKHLGLYSGFLFERCMEAGAEPHYQLIALPCPICEIMCLAAPLRLQIPVSKIIQPPSEGYQATRLHQLVNRSL